MMAGGKLLTAKFNIASLPYIILSLVLIIIQLALTILALWLVYSRQAQLSALTGKVGYV